MFICFLSTRADTIYGITRHKGGGGGIGGGGGGGGLFIIYRYYHSFNL